MSGTDDQILGEARDENNIGDSVCTPASMAQVEARIHDLMQRATGGGAANHIDNRRRLLCQMFYFAANVGTGSREYWMGKTISWTDRGNAARTAQGEHLWDVVLGNPHAIGAMNEPFPRSMKAYLRSRGSLTYKLFKKNPERLVRSTRMGLPENYRYLAADWFDGLHGLSPEEQGAIDCAKQVGLFRSARANKLSTASHYTSGTMEGTSGHIQANAGNLVLRN